MKPCPGCDEDTCEFCESRDCPEKKEEVKDDDFVKLFGDFLVVKKADLVIGGKEEMIVKTNNINNMSWNYK